MPQSPAAIEYPLELMEEIRAFACDELLQLSHAGNEVGGVLFGTRRDDLIQIVTWRPIACEHAHGENFAFSSNDRMNLAVQLELSRQNADLKDLRPVGCFLSHLQDGVSLRPADVEIYSGFFPEAWQVALVLSPQGGGRAQAGFFVREVGEKLRRDGSYRCFDLKPSPLAQETRPAQLPKPQPQRTAASARLQTGLPSGLRPGSGTVPAAAAAPALAAAPQEAAPLELPLPSFQTEEKIPAKERWMWAIPILLALGIAAFMLYQQHGSGANAIGLRVSNQDQTLQIAWDAGSRAVRNAYRGEISIDDGGKQSQISLNDEQLHSGKMSYQAQSGDVGFEFTVYPPNGEPIHDSTRWIAASHAATQPPQLLPEGAPASSPSATNPSTPNASATTSAPANAPDASPAPAALAATPTASPAPATPPANPPATNLAAMSPADQSALQKQVQDLKASLAKERARADELQNLVRILENRLSLQDSKAQRSH